jgi:hypothetical protein
MAKATTVAAVMDAAAMEGSLEGGRTIATHEATNRVIAVSIA